MLSTNCQIIMKDNLVNLLKSVISKKIPSTRVLNNLFTFMSKSIEHMTLRNMSDKDTCSWKAFSQQKFVFLVLFK